MMYDNLSVKPIFFCITFKTNVKKGRRVQQLKVFVAFSEDLSLFPSMYVR